MIGLAIGVFIFTKYFSAWDVTGNVTEIYHNETIYSIQVETGVFSGNQKYNLTIDNRSEIIFNGNHIEFDKFNLTSNKEYRIKAVTDHSALFSDPPVIRADIIEIDER
jgi:hypothetical protein